MGSWLTCRCGGLLHTNMFCGTGISVLASEEFLDASHEEKTRDEFIAAMISDSPKLLHCKSCGRIVILKFLNGEAQVKSYVPEDDGSEPGHEAR